MAPTYELAKEGWRVIRKLANQAGGWCEIHEGDMRLEFHRTGGFLQVKSAHVEGRLRGATLDLVVIDEAAFLPQERWTKELRATLAVKQGEALFLSTFNGRNWFYDIYQRGEDGEHPDWKSWRHKSVENPFIDDEEVEEARRTLPEAVFAQEYEASPLARSGAVFSGEKLQQAIERPLRAGTAYAGLDWGFSGQTALELCREDPEGYVSWFKEAIWTAVELQVRCEAIVGMCAEYEVRVVYADAAAPGENTTLARMLRDAGLKITVVPVSFGKWKHIGINTRRWYLENDLEAISSNCPQLIRDSEQYHYKEGSEDVVKEADHTVDAGTCFYSSRATKLIRGVA